MELSLADCIRLAGWGQLSVLIASALVPMRLKWKSELADLPLLIRQMYWVYGGYVVMGIVALGAMSIACADELSSGTKLAKAVCFYGAVFWGVRLALQPVFDVKPYLTLWWLRAGYYLLTVLFLMFLTVYCCALSR